MYSKIIVGFLMLVSFSLMGCSKQSETQIVDFMESDMNSQVISAQGVSNAEVFGRWTDQGQLDIKFKRNVSGNFRFYLIVTTAFGPNVGQPIGVTIGGVKRDFIAPANNTLIKLDFENVSKTDQLTISIPKPTSPADIGLSTDSRKLGLALTFLAIVPKNK